MELKTRLIRVRMTRAAVLAAAMACVPLSWAGESAAPGGLIAKEIAKRQASAVEGQELLKSGDAAYEAGKYREAVEAYSGARDAFGSGPMTEDLRKAATERMVKASVARAQELSRKGDVAEAKKTLDHLLLSDIAPDDALALSERMKLDDPIRTNPALTKEHAEDVDQVRGFLYQAEGFYNLGQYDKARAKYEAVLRKDPHNVGARRGMEVANQAKRDYYRSAFDETRSTLLTDLDAQWELNAPSPVDEAGRIEIGGNTSHSSVSLHAKLQNTIVPRVDLEDVNIVDAIDFLRGQSVVLDQGETDPTRRGISFFLNLGNDEHAKAIAARKFNLKLQNVPLSEILRYINQTTGTSYVVDESAVVIRSTGQASGALITRTYRVPPDFISATSDGSTGTTATTDVFAEQPKQGLLVRRQTAEEILKRQGITFPEGANAMFNASNSSLVVRNTSDMHLLIEQLVQQLNETEPVQVKVTLTMITATEDRFKELGFDWLVSPFGIGGSLIGSGGSVGNGALLDDVPLIGQLAPQNVVTSGLRSGEQAVASDSIDRLIQAQNSSSGLVAAPRRAPGILSVTGFLNGTQVTMLMRGLDQKKGVDLMTQPSIVTRSGQEAMVKSVQEFIYPTEFEPAEVPNSVGAGASPVTPTSPGAFDMKEVGVIFKVMPTLGANKHYVDLQLAPELVDFDGFVNYGAPINTITTDADGLQTSVPLTPNRILQPVFSRKSINTNVTVADGATIVLGGLLKKKITTVEDKVPILGDAPLVGRLFQSHVHAPISSSVVFLVHVELIDPSGNRINKAP